MPETVLSRVDRDLQAHREEGLAGLKELLAIPSVSAISAHRADVRRAADLIADRLRRAGLDGVAVEPTGGHPVVYAEWLRAEGRPTALLYGHYDVQPADPEALWTSPAFAPAVRDGSLYARGASDDKGQVWMHVLAAESLLRTTGRLPVNLKLMIEGEEEVGSIHLKAYVRENARRLAADVVVISDSGFVEPGLPAIVYGLRGLVSLEVAVRGPVRDLHSGTYGGRVANPLHALAELIAGLHDGGGRVTVEGFYDGVREVSAEERGALAKLPWDEEAWCRELGIGRAFGEPGYTTLERGCIRPTLEINGMWGGFTGEGSKTIVPAVAHAKITCRLVPDQDAVELRRAVRMHLERHCPPGVRLEVEEGEASAATVASVDSEFVRAAARALGQTFGRDPVFIRMGGSIPVVPTLAEIVGAPVVLMGFGLPDDHIHSPDERLNLDNYDRGQRAIAAYWLELGGER